jgi:UDP-N-acetylmuramoyl-tripeptide--D-alanyl-D-alanine ligase
VIPIGISEVAEVVGARLLGEPPSGLVTGASTDSRSTRPGEIFFAISGPRFDGHDFVGAAFERGAAACVVDRPNSAEAAPGRTGPLLVVPDVVNALGRLAASHRRQCRAKVVGITGSNGKTTTKSMLRHLLAARMRTRAARLSFNNHVGVPLTLLSARPDDAVLIVEIGTSGPGEVARLAEMAAPDLAVLTSVGYAHLEGLGGFEDVRAEKMSIFEHVQHGGLGVLNASVVCNGGNWPRRDEMQWVTFGTEACSDVRVTDVESDLTGTRATIEGRYRLELSLPGRHNAVNAAAAWAAARHLGLAPEEILDGLRSCRLPQMRLMVERAGEVTVINDCYNANPSSMSAAIELLRGVRGGRRVLVAGDMAELGESSQGWHRRIGEDTARAGLDLLVTVGREAREIARAAVAAGTTTQTASFADVDEAGRWLSPRLRSGDTVLVKGSRVVGLERLVRSIQDRFADGRGETGVGAGDV